MARLNFSIDTEGRFGLVFYHPVRFKGVVVSNILFPANIGGLDNFTCPCRIMHRTAHISGVMAWSSLDSRHCHTTSVVVVFSCGCVMHTTVATALKVIEDVRRSANAERREDGG